MILTNQNGTRVLVEDNHFAKGGEGAIHRVLGGNFVAKIYDRNERTLWREKKLLGMTAISSAFTSSGIAWPKEILYQNGNFVGFLMENIANSDMLSTVFVNFPGKYTFKDKLEIAINLCERVKLIHSKNQCIGDFSDLNIGIRGNSVFLFDADSFQFNDYLVSKQKYRCLVFTDEFVAPEVLKSVETYKSIKRIPGSPYTIQSDLFVLAIHLFKLLYGCHPFSCRVTANLQQPSVNNSIKTGFSPFFVNKAGFDIPVSAAELLQLPVSIQKMFEEAFIKGNSNPGARPTAAQWLTALKDLSKMPMKTCSKNHVYLAHNKECPWCQARKRMHATGANPRPAPVMAKPQTPQWNTTRPVVPPPVPKVKHSKKFWLVTLIISAIIQLAFVGGVLSFGDIETADSVFMAIMAVAGIVGPVIYNLHAKRERVLNYIVSILLSPLSSVAVIAGMVALSFAASMLLVIAIVAVIISILNG